MGLGFRVVGFRGLGSEVWLGKVPQNPCPKPSVKVGMIYKRVQGFRVQCFKVSKPQFGNRTHTIHVDTFANPRLKE